MSASRPSCRSNLFRRSLALSTSRGLIWVTEAAWSCATPAPNPWRAGWWRESRWPWSNVTRRKLQRPSERLWAHETRCLAILIIHRGDHIITILTTLLPPPERGGQFPSRVKEGVGVVVVKNWLG